MAPKGKKNKNLADGQAKTDAKEAVDASLLKPAQQKKLKRQIEVMAWLPGELASVVTNCRKHRASSGPAIDSIMTRLLGPYATRITLNDRVKEVVSDTAPDLRSSAKKSGYHLTGPQSHEMLLDFIDRIGRGSACLM